VGVLNVGAGFPFKVEGAVPPEVDVLDAVVVQVEEHHRAHAHLACHLVFVGQVGALFVDDGAGLPDGVLQ
jgi:hypothetical protein